MKPTFTLLAVLFLYATVYGQGGSISGKITDTSLKKIMPLATVTVFKATDTTIVTYRLSNQQGEFKIPSLPFDVPLRFMVSFSGYEAFRKDFVLSAVKSSLQFDSVMLYPTYKQLDEVMVIAERPPVVIKQDTIEFNASAFKTLPNALVEDLLKKLPGVQVDADGNITVNGKPVNRLTVDGKNFFGDDPKMATRNLPSNVIDKIQVTDDKEQMQRNGDDNLNNVGKVVNITLKKGVKKGMFGKFYAGGGSDSRYEAGGIANIFRDTLQVSVLGYANNLNKPGFSYSELMQAGGLDRSRGNSISSNTSIWNNGSGSSISINGVNFGGLQNYGGISTSKGAGINLNHAPNAKKSFFGQYFYGNVNVDRRIQTNVSQYSNDTIITNNTDLIGSVITNSHNIGIGARLKPDTLTNILLNANYSIGLTDDVRNSNINSNSNKNGSLSYGNIAQINDLSSYYYRHGISYTQLSKNKKGRRFSFNHNLDVNNRFTDYYTDATTHYVNPNPYDSIIQQLRNEGLPRTDVVAGLTYTEPLSKKWILRFGSRYEYGKLGNGISTYNKGINQEFDKINNFLSSNFSRISHRLNSSIGIDFKLQDLTITPTLRALWQKADNNLASLPLPLLQEQFNFLPALSVVYKQFNFNYDKGIVLPAFNYLLPVSDNTNPYYIVRGNTGLLPSERHSLSVNYYFNNPKKNLNVSLYANANFTKNDVIQDITLDNRGVQTTTPVNADGSANSYINYNISRQYKSNPKFTYQWNTGAYYGYNRSKLLFNSESSWQSTWEMNQWCGFNMNWNDKLEWNNSYSISYNFTDYTNTAFTRLETVGHYANTEFVLRYIKHIIIETNCNYNFNSNIPTGLPKDVIRWNAAINFTMLKDERGVLKLSVFDILNQNNSVSRYATRNMVTTRSQNVLAQYFMATFTYNIRPSMGAKKKVGGREMLLF